MVKIKQQQKTKNKKQKVWINKLFKWIKHFGVWVKKPIRLYRHIVKFLSLFFLLSASNSHPKQKHQ